METVLDKINSRRSSFYDNEKLNLTKSISEFELIKQDIYLSPYENRIRERHDLFKKSLKDIETNEKSIENFGFTYKTMGLYMNDDFSLTFREYAPGAKQISIVRNFILSFISLGISTSGIDLSSFAPKTNLDFFL